MLALAGSGNHKATVGILKSDNWRVAYSQVSLPIWPWLKNVPWTMGSTSSGFMSGTSVKIVEREICETTRYNSVNSVIQPKPNQAWQRPCIETRHVAKLLLSSLKSFSATLICWKSKFTTARLLLALWNHSSTTLICWKSKFTTARLLLAGTHTLGVYMCAYPSTSHNNNQPFDCGPSLEEDSCFVLLILKDEFLSLKQLKHFFFLNHNTLKKIYI